MTATEVVVQVAQICTNDIEGFRRRASGRTRLKKTLARPVRKGKYEYINMNVWRDERNEFYSHTRVNFLHKNATNIYAVKIKNCICAPIIIHVVVKK